MICFGEKIIRKNQKRDKQMLLFEREELALNKVLANEVLKIVDSP